MPLMMKMCGDDSFYLYKMFGCLGARLSPVSPCIVLIWMYPRIIRGNFVKDCPNNIQFNPNNCLNIPLLGRKNTREKSSPRLNFRFESKPISQVLFLGFVFNSRDALLVESWCLNWYKTLYLHAASLQTDLQCSLQLRCITFLQLPEQPRVNILYPKYRTIYEKQSVYLTHSGRKVLGQNRINSIVNS